MTMMSSSTSSTEYSTDDEQHIIAASDTSCADVWGENNVISSVSMHAASTSANASDDRPDSTSRRRRRAGLVLGATCIAFATAVVAVSTRIGKSTARDIRTSAAAAVKSASSPPALRRRLRSLYYAFDADDEDDRDDPIHIVYASDFHSIAGVEASVRSVQAHASAPHRVKFYFIGDDPLPSLPEVQYINLTDAAIKYNVEEFTNPNYERKGKHKREEGVKINTNAANYVRFVMDKLLPRSASKAMWIDSDTIVRCDVVQLVENTLVDSDFVIAAVPVPGPPLGIFPDHRPDYADIRWTFNAGVYVVDLKKWRHEKLTEVMRKFAQKNREEVIYKFGSQPPLTLTFKEDFEHLPTGWNVKVEKATDEQVEDACLLHWAGANKPWNGNGEHIEIWNAYDTVDESVEDLH
mmetsp:Transcript_1175/g.2458  ORF Transcript_1175/g.2458 Transcript_1175/m.2458 type:complete len:408 (-) Transcript_1175:404-1627(-)